MAFFKTLSCKHLQQQLPEVCIDEPDLNRPIGFIISPLPSGEQQTDNLLNIIARPKDEVHLLCATNNVLWELRGESIFHIPYSQLHHYEIWEETMAFK